MPKRKAAPAVQAPVIKTSRVVDAPRDRVFEAFRDPKRLARWWGPRGFTNTFREFDLRPGGTWRFTMHGPDGANYDNHSTFLEVVKPERVLLRHESAPPFLMTIAFVEQGAKTHVTWSMRFDSPEERDRVARVVIDANEENLDRLEAELAIMG